MNYEHLNMRILFTIFVLFYFSALKADINENGNENKYKVEKIEPENGFPSHLIYKMFQDSKGFIWYGTMYGLYRYDGVTYKAFRYDPADSTTIGNDDVISIFEDRKGSLWFGTYLGGVSRYNSASSSFTRFVHTDDHNSLIDNTVWAITEDRKGVLWFGTQNGLSKFENNTFSTVSEFNYNPGNNTIFTLTADKQNNLWIGSLRNGLFRYSDDRKIFDRFKRNDSSPDSINGNTIRSVYCDKIGNLWVGMVQRGVCMIKAIDLENGLYKFNRQLFDSTKENSPANKSVYEFVKGNNNDVFICSSDIIYEYDLNSQKFSGIDLKKPEGSKSQNVAMLYDNSGCIWVSSYENCLYKAVKPLGDFTNFSETGSVRALFNDMSDHCILISGDLGIFEFHPESSNLKKIELKTPFSSAYNIAKDKSGNLFLGTDIGLLKISNYKKDDQKEELFLSGIPVFHFIFDGDNFIAGTSAGLYFINSVNYDTVHYTHNPSDNNSLNDLQILSLFIDKDDNIWAGTYAGLNKFDRAGRTFSHFTKTLNDTNSLSNNYIYSIIQKDNISLFLGTAGGLNIFNYKENKFRSFKENGFQSSVINSILPYGDQLWTGTNNGIAKINLSDNSVKIYGKDEGIQGNIFNSNSILMTAEGMIIAGSRSGFILFDPGKLKNDNSKPVIGFTDLKLYEEGKNRIKDISGISSVDLNYDQNNLQIDFSLKDYYNPDKNLYEYKLNGSDESWISSGNKNTVFYSGLNPGKYELMIRGVNYNGIRSDERSLLLIIHPPFWKTTWFYLMLAILFISLIYGIYKYRLKKNISLAIKMEQAKEEEREKWREQASIDYHDELGHKLTRISMYSRRVLKKLNGSADEFGADINNIIETSNSLRMSARDLIWSLNPSEDSLFDFVTRVNHFANELLESTSLNYHKCDNKSEWKNVELAMDVKRQLLFILKEGINNAVKHSDAGNVWFNVKVENKNFTFEVSDDGKGFENSIEYTGYGLLNIQKRAAKAGFDFKIDSSIGNGTKIKIYNVEYITQSISNN
ncbi:hypothetical protein BH10BAC5_BH10BAC5_18160 [soil metagenome]